MNSCNGRVSLKANGGVLLEYDKGVIKKILQYSSELNGVVGYFRLVYRVMFFKFELSSSAERLVYQNIASRNHVAQLFLENSDYTQLKIVKRFCLYLPRLNELFSRERLIARFQSKVTLTAPNLVDFTIFTQYGVIEDLIIRKYSNSVSLCIHSYIPRPRVDWTTEDQLNYILRANFSAVWIPESYEGTLFAMEIANQVDRIFWLNDDCLASVTDYRPFYYLRYLARNDLTIGLFWHLFYSAIWLGRKVCPHPKNKILCFIFQYDMKFRKVRRCQYVLDKYTSDSVRFLGVE